MMYPIFTDFDDQDAYKFFMQYAVLKHFPDAGARYSLILRDPSIEFPPGFGDALKDQIRYFQDIRFTAEIEEHLNSQIPWFDSRYFKYLRDYRFDPEEVTVLQEGTSLRVNIEGLWHKAILWEVPLMACISELYFQMYDVPDEIELNIPRWEKKFTGFESMKIAVIEFGTRRRKSKRVQEKAIETFLKTAPKTIKGSSNVMFARKFGINASGTQAHEWFMFHAARFGVENATRSALQSWIDTYHGALGIALTDTYTTDVFFRDLDLFFSKLFDGIRQDSGDPVVFAEKAIRHYLEKKIVLPNGIIPKTLVFSDSIDSLEKIAAIEACIRNRIFSVYGIGTWITNDVARNDGSHVKPLNMVIKMTDARPDGHSDFLGCAKLTDCPEKRSGNEETIRQYLEELKM
jgi:nicotinate phosphoribosyltransferase